MVVTFTATSGGYTTGDLVTVIVVVGLAALAAGAGITLLISGRLTRSRVRDAG